MLIRGGFILKAAERAKVPLKSGTRDFWNSHSLKWLVYLYVTINRNFEYFHYSNFERGFLKDESFFQKLEHCFLVDSTNFGVITFSGEMSIMEPAFTNITVF